MSTTEQVGGTAARFVPPPGPGNSRPRACAAAWAERWSWSPWCCLPVAVVAGGILLQQVAQRDAAQRRQVMRETGVETTAEVTRLWRGSGDQRPAWVAYRFEAGGRA